MLLSVLPIMKAISTSLCLNKDVLYTVLVMMNMVRGDPISLLLPNRYVIALTLPSCTNFSYIIVGCTDQQLIDSLYTGHTAS